MVILFQFLGSFNFTILYSGAYLLAPLDAVYFNIGVEPRVSNKRYFEPCGKGLQSLE